MRHWINVVLMVWLLTASSSLANTANDDDDAIVSNEEDSIPQADETVQRPAATVPPPTEESELDDGYKSPTLEPGTYHFKEDFDNIRSFEEKWIRSQAKKDDAVVEIAKYDGVWSVESPIRRIYRDDLGLVLKSKVKHAAIGARLQKPFIFGTEPLIVQYEVTLQDGQECGGSYLKLLSKPTSDLTQFNDKTPYTIMFGPDKCGNDIKLHFIFRHVNPINGSIEEKHCRKAKDRLEEPFKDKQPHLYTLIIQPDNTYKIKVDNKIINQGSLLTDFTPPVNPPKEIDDPTDHKPKNWDEREKIPDPESFKPEDWDEDAPAQIPDDSTTKPDGWLDDEETMISDPTAIKPDDWDTDMDGDWEPPLINNPICEKAVGCGLWTAPMIPNPNYRGKWRAPLIDNPNYQGKWAPRRIPNPEYFNDENPFKRMTPITAVGFELWSISADILFDNILITDSEQIAEEFATQTFELKRQKLDADSKTLWVRSMRYMNNKPGWWALYFFYCLIPISVYVWYLSRRVKEESFVTRIIRYTNENPALWAVYVVVVGLPLAFLIYFCCQDKGEKPYASNIKKKIDELSPDDEEDEDEINMSNNEKDNGAGGDYHSNEQIDDDDENVVRHRKPTKADLEDAPISGDDSNESDSEPIPDLTDVSHEEKTATPPPQQPPQSSGPEIATTENIKKRKPRRE